MTREELQKIRGWADDKIATGIEPPWSWYQLMKLREALDAILSGMPVPDAGVKFRPHLVGKEPPKDEVTTAEIPVQLPM